MIPWPRFTRVTRVLTVTVALSAAPGAPAIAADCPTALLQLSTVPGMFGHPAAVFDTTLSDPDFTSRIAYDLIEGRLALSMTPVSGEEVFLFVGDLYDVVGLPIGTPIDIAINLEIDGSIGTPGCGGLDCGARFVARVFDEFFDATTVVVAPATTGSTTRHEVLSLPIHLTAGAPVRLGAIFDMTVAPGGNHGGEWTGRLYFTGVPAGARIVSCHGYGGDPTPARQASWGRIKTRYR